jgi:hypothetical protein
MRTHQLWLQRITKLGLVLIVAASMSACAGLFGSSMKWKEEVQLHDGQVLVVERHYSLGGYSTLDARERQALDQTVTFTLPGANKRVFWETEYRQDLPEPNSLSPLLLDIVGGVAYLATSPAGCIAYNKWGRPNPPYVLFKYVNDAWQQIPMKEFPSELVGANLMSRPASSLLKSYYTVEAARAQRNDGNVATYATTIFHEPIRSAGEGCGELIRTGDGGWEGTLFFSNQPSKEACLKYCEQQEVSAKDCPCNRLFKEAK